MSNSNLPVFIDREEAVVRTRLQERRCDLHGLAGELRQASELPSTDELAREVRRIRKELIEIELGIAETRGRIAVLTRPDIDAPD